MTGMMVDPVPQTLGPGLVSPLTLKGDIWVRSATGDSRLGVGTDGTVPVADSTQANGIAWTNATTAAQNKQIISSFTSVALAANTYNNGTSGVGATLTANANGALNINGSTPSFGAQVVVAFEATTQNNGLYTVSNTGTPSTKWVLTRSIYMNQPYQFFGSIFLYNGLFGGPGAVIFCNSAVTTIGVDSISFSSLRFNAVSVTATGSPGANTLLHGDYSWSAVANADMATMAANTFKMNNTAGVATPTDVTAAAVKTALNLSNTNSGDVTAAAFGATPNANGMTLTAQALNLQPANASNPGGLLAADWTAFNRKAALVSANTSVPVGNTVANTVTTSKFTSQPILPAAVTAGSVIRVKGWGVFGTGVGTQTINLQALLGATTIATFGAVTLSPAASNLGWSFESDIIVLSNTSIEVQSKFQAQSATSGTVINQFMPNTAAVTVAAVNSGVLALQVTWNNASASDTITLRHLSVEVLPA